jgi:hypothetical protein
MSADNTIQAGSRKQKVHTLLASAIFLIGLALMIFMITTESEPGALPLLLVVIGIGWLLIARFALRPRHK